MTMEYVSMPGETVPPVPEGPKLCDGDDMRILHNAFLWGYEEAPGLVRGAPAGDVARSEFLGQWLALHLVQPGLGGSAGCLGRLDLFSPGASCSQSSWPK